MKRIGEILIEHGTLTQKQLEAALKEQKQQPDRLLGELLIELGYVTEEDIVAALATQFNIPYLPIANFTIDESVTGLISRELVEKYICVPLDRIGNFLTVVMADPTNERAVSDIEAITKCKVQVFVATTTEIVAAIEKYYKIQVAPGSKPDQKVSQISFRSAVDQKREEKTVQKK